MSNMKPLMSNFFLTIFVPIFNSKSPYTMMFKKTLILAVCTLAILTANAETTTTLKMDMRRSTQSNTGRDRGPVRIPEVGVTYDSNTHVLQIECESQDQGAVYLYDLNGTIEGFASAINCTIDVPVTGSVHVLHIEGLNWIGETKFYD